MYVCVYIYIYIYNPLKSRFPVRGLAAVEALLQEATSEARAAVGPLRIVFGPRSFAVQLGGAFVWSRWNLHAWCSGGRVAQRTNVSDDTCSPIKSHHPVSDVYWVFITGGCSGRGVQWMGVILYNIN